jgi:hypothetical protein
MNKNFSILHNDDYYYNLKVIHINKYKLRKFFLKISFILLDVFPPTIIVFWGHLQVAPHHLCSALALLEVAM